MPIAKEMTFEMQASIARSTGESLGSNDGFLKRLLNPGEDSRPPARIKEWAVKLGI